ncbi:hypothetical protein CI102_9609 [Trichoderma harzianum]|uniref:Uncharacterized protein n=1 Tax=Trichoderma harzianum CBS 226.95 TaxID=983964 RepID=A0A2T4AQ86_TRIHA|nr:hypothetical protein M431DRAFT_1857 [Trichoderma harzianum CBS 226.95]PKK43216.1 hypothetical protein CI102_9609 [Trichoderma harzianum]PTB59221.1 hypothetical protein M431DRAFT_1857 [Trichoderma harzianum CBS 226.95]
MSDANAPPWHLISLRSKDDGGQEVMSPTGARLVETTASGVIYDGDLVAFDVIARCCFIGNGVDKATSRKANKDGQRDWERLKEELRGKKNADGKTITPKTRKGETREPGRVHDQIPENNLGGLVIKSEPASTITGRAIIPHNLMTVKENLLAAKRLVSGVPLEDVFNTPELLAHYNGTIETLIRNLENGKALEPPALITPHEPQGVRAGFRFCLPPIEALEFPPELLRILDEFIKLYPGDLIDRRVALIGCFIFQGIMDHTEMQMEKYFQIKKAANEPYQAVPEQSLAATIICTPHVLR